MVAFAGNSGRGGGSPLWVLGFALVAFSVESCGGAAGSGGRPGGTGGARDVAGGSNNAGGTDGGSSASGGAGTGGQGSGGRGAMSSCKRGVAYGHHSVADLSVLSPGVSFWYNWDFRPDQALRGGAYRGLGVEYVPMIWGLGSDREAAVTEIPLGATSLLGFNEPNFGSQADLSAQEAALLWQELEAVADIRDLKLVSPAVNFCGGDCQDTDPFRYLDEFFESCEGCRVDAVAMHIYVGCSPSGENKAEWLIGHVETYKSRFSEPLWLTEFACDSAQNFAEQEAFLKDAVAYLEAEPRIERYAWFAGRADNMAFVDLLGEDGELTSLGQAYVGAARNPECQR